MERRTVIIEETASSLVDVQVENPWKVLGLLAVLTAVILPGALQMEIKPSTEAVLPQDDPSVQSLDDLRAKFYGDSTLVVFQSDEDVRNHDLLSDISRFEKRMVDKKNVQGSMSPATMLERRYGHIPEDPETLEDFNYGSMVSDDYETLTVNIRADTQANSDEIRRLHDDVMQELQAIGRQDQVTLTGYNMIDLATFQVIISDFTVITGVSFLAVLTILFITFRSPKKVLLPVSVVMFGLMWMIGLGGWLGADLTIISMVSAAMIMGLGIDFGIHVTKKYYRSEGGVEGLSETMVELSRGLLGASLTTAVGFLALLTAQLTGMHSLGIFLFTGIISAYLGSTVLLPTILVLTENISKQGESV